MSLNEENETEPTPEHQVCWAYDPLPSQASFLGRTERFKGFSGPVGSGKSAALCVEAISLANINVGRKGLLGAPTLGMLRDATQATLFDLLDRLDFTYEFRKTDGDLSFANWDGTVLLRSLDEPERLRGTNLAWFGIDELSYAREEAWLRLEARLRDPKAKRLAGLGAWTPAGHNWTYKRFIHQPVSGYGCVRAKPFENRFLLERTPDYYERLQSSYDPKFFQQEALGDYINSRGDRVYHCFNRDVHVTACKYDRNKPLFWGLDFNVAPMSSVVAQKVGEKLVVIDEIVLPRGTTAEACEEFANRYGRHAGEIEIFGDASGHAQQTTGDTDYGMVGRGLIGAGIRKTRMRVASSNPAVIERVQKVNALLVNAYGEVRLEIDPRCVELIQDLDEVMFKPDTGVIDKLHDAKRTHTSDALGYMIWEMFGEKPKAGEVNQRLY